MAFAAAIPAVASLAGGALGALGASSAAKAQEKAAEKAVDFQQIALEMSRQDQFQWLSVGEQALLQYADVLGISRPTTAMFVPGSFRSIGKFERSPEGAFDNAPPSIRVNADGTFGGSVYDPALASARSGVRGTPIDDYNPYGVPTAAGGGSQGQQYRTERRVVGSRQEQTGRDQFENVPIYGEVQVPIRSSGGGALSGVNVPRYTDRELPPELQKGYLDFAGELNMDPGYEFRRNEGQRGLEASASARGRLFTGATGQAVSRYNQDYASAEYDKVWNRRFARRIDSLNRVGALAGVGQNAAAGLASSNANFANNAGTARMEQGAQSAAGTVGAFNNLSRGLEGFAQGLGQSNFFQPSNDAGWSAGTLAPNQNLQAALNF